MFQLYQEISAFVSNFTKFNEWYSSYKARNNCGSTNAIWIFFTILGEKKFPCSICSKKFMRSDHLNKHMKTHQRKVADSTTTLELTVEENDMEEEEEGDRMVSSSSGNDIIVSCECYRQTVKSGVSRNAYNFLSFHKNPRFCWGISGFPRYFLMLKLVSGPRDFT